METPATEPRPGSDQHDVALALALGSLAVARRFEAAVARESRRGSQPLAADDPVVIAALGAISLGRSLRRWLEEAAAPIERPRADPPSTPMPTPRGILR